VIRSFLALLWVAFLDWRRDRADRLAAALAYYTLFSIPPLLILVMGLAGLVFGRDAVQERVLGTLAQLFGRHGVDAIRAALGEAAREGAAKATAAGVVLLILGASGVFGHLKDSLDTIWNVAAKPGGGWKGFLEEYVFSLLVLLGTFFLLIVSLAMNAVLAAFGDYLGRTLPGGAGLWAVVNFVLSMGVIALLFALMFRYIPSAKVGWSAAWRGGVLTSVLFTAGEAAIGFYLGRSNVGSGFGVAGSLVVILVWVYYSALIFFYGAEFTQAYGQRVAGGRRPLPSTRSAGGVP
jgi:membrane protein